MPPASTPEPVLPSDVTVFDITGVPPEKLEFSYGNSGWGIWVHDNTHPDVEGYFEQERGCHILDAAFAQKKLVDPATGQWKPQYAPQTVRTFDWKRPIPDSQISKSPVTEGSLQRHYRYNPATGKYDSPDLTADTHNEHEKVQGQDTNLALALHAFADQVNGILNVLRKEASSKKISTYDALLTDFNAFRDQYLPFAWRAKITRAMIVSLNGIYHPDTTTSTVAWAMANAAAFLTALGAGNTAGALGFPCADYVDKFIERLEADGALAHGAAKRNWKRKFVIVTALTDVKGTGTPAVTAASVLATIKAALAPSA